MAKKPATLANINHIGETRIRHGGYSITLGGKDREGKLFVPSESDC
jgi:hypothetical protein